MSSKQGLFFLFAKISCTFMRGVDVVAWKARFAGRLLKTKQTLNRLESKTIRSVPTWRKGHAANHPNPFLLFLFSVFPTSDQKSGIFKYFSKLVVSKFFYLLSFVLLSCGWLLTRDIYILLYEKQFIRRIKQ